MTSEPLSHKKVLAIALPIMLANASIPLMGIVDSYVVGQIPTPEPLAAVGLGAIALTTVFWVFGFLRMGTTGLTAQAKGAGREGEVAALLTRSLFIGLASGLALIALQPLIFRGALAISAASPEAEAMAQTYMAIRIWAAPAAIATYGLSGWLIGLERTGAVMVQQLVINGINIALSLYFVLELNWGVAGVAWASFAADWIGLGVGLWLCRDAFARPSWRDWPRIFDRTALRNMAVVNTDILIRSLFLMSIFTSFVMLSSRFGDATVAANQVLLQFVYFTGYAMDGFAFAAESLIGQAYGARQIKRLRRAALLSTLWATVMALILTGIFWGFGPAMIHAMSKSPEVQDLAMTYLPWMIAAPVLQIGLIMLDGIFIGATRSADMRNMMVLSAALYALSVAVFLPMGNHGLWLALTISFVARGITLMARYPALERAAAKA